MKDLLVFGYDRVMCFVTAEAAARRGVCGELAEPSLPHPAPPGGGPGKAGDGEAAGETRRGLRRPHRPALQGGS